MRFALALLAALMVSPAMAQQRRSPPAAQAPAAAQPAPVSGWTRPIAEFPAAFNEAAQRLGLPLRATSQECYDITDPHISLSCHYMVGRVSVDVSTSEDKSTLKTISVQPQDGARNFAEDLRNTQAILLQLLEPTVPQARRAAMLLEIRTMMTVRPASDRELTLGETQLSRFGPSLIIERASPAGATTRNQQAAPAGPETQAPFGEILRRFERLYSSSYSTPLRLPDIRRQRAQEICALLPGLRVQGWIGDIRAVERMDDGAIAVDIYMPHAHGTEFMTSSSSGTPLARLTQIPGNSPLAERLKDIPVGSRILLDAELIPGPDDCILGTRQTEQQMMIGPRFFVRFTDIRRPN